VWHLRPSVLGIKLENRSVRQEPIYAYALRKIWQHDGYGTYMADYCPTVVGLRMEGLHRMGMDLGGDY
jgi:hypothetical protein